ncbi:hypothetical protein M8C21_016143 [Ambrosia artemisiifolia]|uniref:Uncharacterized protein n=1 Tax=Ambrosia artemisiifolia TaxID=4212 RepID=A0AAD5CL47_AMBAR|nr:hypothetical protein M8C21_016143 [Ambrosia artemisiifolia]
MMQISDDGSKKIDRKTIEKNRRTHMKKLCFKLNSLVPSLSSQPFKRIEVLKGKRNEALRYLNGTSKNNPCSNVKDDQLSVRCKGVRTQQSKVEVDDLDGGLKVLLISNSERKIPFSKIISIVEDGGAEVVKGGYTSVDDKVIYTLHAKARYTRLGIEVASVQQKLQELINQSL